MSDKFYSYSDGNDEINVSTDGRSTSIKIGVDDVVFTQEELPKLIAVLQSHLEEPVDDRPWVIVTMSSDIIGPFTSEANARKQTVSSSDLVRQATPPSPPTDHAWAGKWAEQLVSVPSTQGDKNLARAYLELSAKQ